MKKDRESYAEAASKKTSKSRSTVARLALALTPSKKRKKPQSPTQPRNDGGIAGASEVKDSIDPDKVAADLEKGDGHWSSDLSFPKWCAWKVFTLAWIVNTTSAVVMAMTAQGKSADGFKMCQDANHGAAICFVVYCDAMKIASGNAKEVLKLCFPFYSEGEFVQAVTASLGEIGHSPSRTVIDAYSAFHALLNAPKKARKLVREIATEMARKAAKTDPEVSDFDKSVNDIRKMLKEYHTEKRKNLDILRTALKEATEEYENDRKKYTKTEEFLVEYTNVKSGKIPASIQEDAVKTYRARANLQKKYTLEQYLSIFRLKYGNARIKSGLGTFRGNRGYTKGLKFVKTWEKARKPPSPSPDNEGGEEEDAANDDDRRFAAGVLADIDEEMEE